MCAATEAVELTAPVTVCAPDASVDDKVTAPVTASVPGILAPPPAISTGSLFLRSIAILF